MKLLVIGGNGFLGSAVCKAAISRGYEVASLSKSGKPPRLPSGELPAWTSKVSWNAGSAHEPSTYAHLLPATSSVVHTLGTLFEGGGYKKYLRGEGTIENLAKSLRGNDQGNPLMRKKLLDEGAEEHGVKTEPAETYERVNRDSAITVLRTLIDTPPMVNTKPTTFVYISAEDIFRPFVPSGYIETKRQAEQDLYEMVIDNEDSAVEGKRDIREVFVRPGLMYHPQLRPMVMPVSSILSLSSALSSKAPILPNIIRSINFSSKSSNSSNLVPSNPFSSLANALEVPPMHVDDVAEAILECISDGSGEGRGVMNVNTMRGILRAQEARVKEEGEAIWKL